MNAEKGVITNGRCYTDCLVPNFIDELNDILQQKKLTYDEKGIHDLGNELSERFKENELVREQYIPELVSWMRTAI